MNEEIIMSKEAFEELVNGFEFIESLTLYGRKSLKYHIKRLQEENQQLKEQLQQKEDIINKAREYIKENAYIYTNIMGKEVGFFKRHDDGWTPIELLEILNIDKGE